MLKQYKFCGKVCYGEDLTDIILLSSEGVSKAVDKRSGTNEGQLASSCILPGRSTQSPIQYHASGLAAEMYIRRCPPSLEAYQLLQFTYICVLKTRFFTEYTATKMPRIQIFSSLWTPPITLPLSQSILRGGHIRVCRTKISVSPQHA